MKEMDRFLYIHECAVSEVAFSFGRLQKSTTTYDLTQPLTLEET